MEAASIAHAEAHEHHGPAAREPQLAGRGPAARDAAFHHLRGDGLRGLLHGLLLHPHRPGRAVAGARNTAPGRGRRRQHRDPRVLLVHAPLGRAGDQEGQPLRPEGGDAARPCCSAARSSSSRSTSTPTSASPPRTAPRRRSSTRSRACTAPTCSSACAAAYPSRSAPSAGHYSPEEHRGVEVPGIYWHFVDIMWLVVYTTVYIL